MDAQKNSASYLELEEVIINIFPAKDVSTEPHYSVLKCENLDVKVQICFEIYSKINQEIFLISLYILG